MTQQTTCKTQDPFTCGEPATVLVQYNDPKFTDVAKCPKHAKKSQRAMLRQLNLTVTLINI